MSYTQKAYEIAVLRAMFNAPANETADPTEDAMHAVMDAVGDFEDALDNADCHARAMQLWDRLRAMAILVARAQDAAARRSEQLSRRNR